MAPVSNAPGRQVEPTQIDNSHGQTGLGNTGAAQSLNRSGPPAPPVTMGPPPPPPLGGSANQLGPPTPSEIRGCTSGTSAGLAEDPLAALKNDPEYKLNERELQALDDLLNGDFDAIETKFTSLFNNSDGVLNADNIYAARDYWFEDAAGKAGREAAKKLLANTGLLEKLQKVNPKSKSFTKEDVIALRSQLKEKRTTMETDAKKAFADAHPTPQPVGTAAGTGTPNTTPPVTGGAPTAGADGTGNVASSANAAGAKAYTNEQILDAMNRLKDGGFASIDHQGVSNEEGNKDGLIAWPDVVKAAGEGNAMAKELMAHPEIWEKMDTMGGTKAADGLVRTADLGEGIKAMTLAVRADVRAEMSQETPKPTPSTLGGLEGAQENMNNLLGWADTEMERLSGLYAKTSDPAAQKEIENKMNALTRKMQQISNMMNQIMSMISNISKMWSDISMNAIRNMK
jgi:hypothetical protein